jgi:hypothetical protein
MDKDLKKLIKNYQEEMKKPVNKEYDKGYIDAVVDLLGDLITFLDYDELNPFSDAMEEIQSKLYDKGVL